LTYQVEKTFNENKEKLDSASTTQLETALSDAKKALEEGGAERMNDAYKNLETASHKLAEALYQQQSSQTGGEAGGGEQANAAGASASGGQGGTASGGDDNVIDAEYVDVDENK
jgi:molecular chaperone DnaK